MPWCRCRSSRITAPRQGPSATATSGGWAIRRRRCCSSFSNSSKVQGYNSSSSSARLQLGLESAYTNDSSNGGYGSFSATLFSVNAGLSHYASDGTPAWDLAGFLLIQADTTPGREFFCYTIAPIGTDINTQNHTLLLFRSPAVSGWSVVLNRSNSYTGMFYSLNSYTWSNNALVAASIIPLPPSGSDQQLIRGCGLYANTSSGVFAPGIIQPRIALPDCFWLGSNQLLRPAPPGPGEQPRRSRHLLPAGGGLQRRHRSLVPPPTRHAATGGLGHGRFLALANLPGSTELLPAAHPRSSGDGTSHRPGLPDRLVNGSTRRPGRAPAPLLCQAAPGGWGNGWRQRPAEHRSAVAQGGVRGAAQRNGTAPERPCPQDSPAASTVPRRPVAPTARRRFGTCRFLISLRLG